MKFFLIQRVQCGNHYTVASTEDNELYYWGLRFKTPSPIIQEDDSYSSTNGSVINTGDLRLESITPRKASDGHSRQNSTSNTSVKGHSRQNSTSSIVAKDHSRQNSTSSINEIVSEKGGKSHSRQLSLGSVTDSFNQKDKETMLRRDSGNHSRHASSSDLRSNQASSVDLRKDHGSQSKLGSGGNIRDPVKTHSRQTSLTSAAGIVGSREQLSKDEGITYF